jgi:hypothetical protein
MKKMLVITILISLCGCKKYPDDSTILHLNSVKTRLCRTWCYKADSGDCNGELDIKSDGTFVGRWPFMSSVNEKNTWELTNKFKNIQFTNSQTNIKYDYSITRLEHIQKTWYCNLKNDSTTFRFSNKVYN